jgi:hypothetical protein
MMLAHTYSYPSWIVLDLVVYIQCRRGQGAQREAVACSSVHKRTKAALYTWLVKLSGSHEALQPFRIHQASCPGPTTQRLQLFWIHHAKAAAVQDPSRKGCSCSGSISCELTCRTSSLRRSISRSNNFTPSGRQAGHRV